MRRKFNTKYQAAIRQASIPRKYGTREETKRIVELLRTRPDLAYEEIGRQFGRTPFAVGSIAKRNGLQHGYSGYLGSRRFVNRARITISVPKVHSAPKRVTMRERDQMILDYVQAHPEMTYQEIGTAFNIPACTVGGIVYRYGVRRSAVTPEIKAKQKELADYVAAHPQESYSDIGRKFGVLTLYVARAARKHGVFRGKGQGPRHNGGRSGYGSPRTDEEREHLSKVMSDIWSGVSKIHKERLGRIMRRHWDDETKREFGSAVKKMWKEAKALDLFGTN
jgi:hypothetical protein